MSTLRITMKSRILGNEQRNVFYVAGAFAEIANAQDIVDYMRDAWAFGSPNLVGSLNTDWELWGADVKDVTDPANPTIPLVFTSGVLTGLQAGDPLPLQNCLLVSFTALAAPPNRSRKYLGGFNEGAHSSTGWSAGITTAATSWGDRLLDMVASLDPGIALVVSRFTSSGVLVGSNILDALRITDYARTQRRRTPGRGI